MKICRICLDNTADKTYFKDAYAEEYFTITHSEVSKMEGFPVIFCIRCAYLMRKYVKFRKQCLDASAVLENYVRKTKELQFIDFEKTTDMVTSKILQFEILKGKWKRKQSIVVYSHEETVNSDHKLSVEVDIKDNDTTEQKIDPKSLFFNSDEPLEADIPLLNEIKEERPDSDYEDKDNLQNYYPDFEIQGYATDDSDAPLSRTKKAKKEKMKDEKEERKISKRMVMETAQYTVIKLSDAEVLEEMNQKRKTSSYLDLPYRCELCVKGFNYDDVLRSHMLHHQQIKDYPECHLCHQFVPSVVSLRGHIKSHTTKYSCKKCGIVKRSRQHLLEHFASAHDNAPKTYICTECGKICQRRTMYQKHMRMHSAENKIACTKCGKLFKSIETLRAHMLRHEDVKRYRCDKCPKAFRYSSLLYTHKFTHVTAKKFYCVECDVYFKTATNLKLHLRKSRKHVNFNNLKHACTLCNKRYDDTKSLQQHVDWFHMKRRNHKCSRCEMAFGSADGLRSHIKKKHDGVKQLRKHHCELCNKAFKTKAVLIKHIRVHTGERPYECHQCGKKFAQYSTLTTHIKLVHLKVERCKKKSTVGQETASIKQSHNDLAVITPIQPHIHGTYQNVPEIWTHHTAVSGSALSDTVNQINSYT